jgi:hypothetical protein
LLEPQRTNVYTYSEQFDNAAWNKQSVTVSANAGTSPDGTANADKVIPSTSTAFQALYHGTTTATSFTYGVFAKAAGYNYIVLLDQFSSVFTNVVFNLSAGTCSAGGKIENYGNGWYRCSVSAANAGAATAIPTYAMSPDGTNVAFAGNGTSGVLLWGAQFESGAAYPTSYIPTTSAAVTRLADAAFKASASSVLSNSTGTLFLEVERQGPSGADPENLIFTSDTSLSNFVNIVFSPASNRYRAQVRQGGTTTGSAEASSAYTGKIKMAAAWAANDLVLYINGVLQATDTSVTIPSATFNSFGLGSYYDGAYGPDTFRGKYSQALIFKTRLTNAQLAELTTL